MATNTAPAHSKFDLDDADNNYPLQVLQSRRGFYLGTVDDEGMPFSRESAEYFRNHKAAENALNTGKWTRHSLSI
ncbi:hypothetical protein BGI51_22120 [Pseudomonas oryzihabitans]|uniref:hypothetical protein n=1 Tax=Pseudomonas oryzihabitans TaxID=47885 RepID=UPI00165E8E56|nr:hypothetical protein [Pseudomonas psychrotolerans]QNR00118.1 hypothetical protein BGI51_22120 [Pseudomonas psychrotolerans]